MYCYEAQKCQKFDCPVQRLQIKRCWEYLQKLHNKEVTENECPYAPCERCNYRLGWEIGLIGESLFPDLPDPTPESLIPVSEEDEVVDEEKTSPQVEISNAEESSDQDSKSELNDATENSVDSISPEELLKEQPEIDQEKIGQPGMRFCHEIVECPNPNCVVRRRQIVECFKFFSRRTPEEKEELTCTKRKCADCFYKKGWDIGILNEKMFADIIEARRLKIARADRIKKNTLVEIYLAELSKKPLSREEEIALAKKIVGDREASELFLMANLKLVTRIAGQFSNRGLGLMDLIQEGNIGLIKAISKFDFTLGYRFSTYAAYWIRYYMQKAVANQGSSIRIPYHLLTVAHKIRRKIQEYEYANYCAPSLTELAKLVGLEEEKILSVIRITQTPISIHAKVGDDDEEDTMEYFLSDRKALTPEETAIERLKNEAINKAIEDLPERLKYLIKHFYGFSEDELNLAEIGRRLNISRERARQLLHQALQILQENEFIKNLE
ncbi:MAG: sigma-70 family RNA polymerase sigma factor [Candidatus Rifleibacteriota bacterium]